MKQATQGWFRRPTKLPNKQRLDLSRLNAPLASISEDQRVSDMLAGVTLMPLGPDLMRRFVLPLSGGMVVHEKRTYRMEYKSIGVKVAIDPLIDDFNLKDWVANVAKEHPGVYARSFIHEYLGLNDSRFVI